MRGVSNVLARSLAVTFLVVALSAPAVEARPRDGVGNTKNRIVKIIKKWIVTVLDELSEPKP